MPWMRQSGTDEAPALVAIAGPDALVFRGMSLRATDHAHRGTVTVAAGERTDLTLTWFPSHRETPGPVDMDAALESTREWWDTWAEGIEHSGPHHAEVVRSLLVPGLIGDVGRRSWWPWGARISD